MILKLNNTLTTIDVNTGMGVILQDCGKTNPYRIIKLQ